MPNRPGTAFAALAGLFVYTLLPTAALAQLANVRPGDEKLALPEFEESPAPGVWPPLLELPEVPPFTPSPRPQGHVLPSLALPQDDDAIDRGGNAFIREVRIRGNSVLPDETLEAITFPFVDREISFEDVQQLRDELSRAYVERGYATSGAVVPAQPLDDGVLEVWIVEGRVGEIEVRTDGRLSEAYVRRRLARSIGPPVNVNELERGLHVLQQDQLIERLEAQLVPGERRGEAVLRVAVTEAPSLNLRLAGNNYNSPAIGGGRGEVHATWKNVSGFGDTLRAVYKGSSGLQDVRAHWTWPISSFDTRFEAFFRKTWSEVVEAPFDEFDISNRTSSYGFRLTQPLYRSENVHSEAFVLGEYRRSESLLFGDPFSFVAGPKNGVAKLTVMRFGGSYTWRTLNEVVAARSTLSLGLPWLGATRNDAEGVPDAKFVAWLGQLQWARRFPEAAGLQILVRADIQISDRPLFGLEQFAVGGHDTVRGYRENRLVRDNGAVGSIELRIPVPAPSWREWQPSFELAPFYDVGYSWNTERPEVGERLLMSVGVGGRLGLTKNLDFEVYWGYDLRDVVNPGSAPLQDEGVSMGLLWTLP